MYQKQITDREAGQRFDKYLHKLLPEAGSSFLYKMLRKKNITLNGKKADGGEKLTSGDQVEIFFSEETLAKFMGSAADDEYTAAYQKCKGITVLYENGHILLADKPAGVLTQKAKWNDVSLNEWLIGYLLAKGEVTRMDLQTFKPSVCNRLDRNTSGIVLCAKTVAGAQLLGGLLQDRTLHKYYQLYVKGKMQEERQIEGVLVKDGRTNRVTVKGLTKGMEAAHEDTDAQKESYICTRYRPLSVCGDKTLLEVELLTGKPHQIRAHLASIGHPLLGDYKYGDARWNDEYKRSCQVRAQLLHAYKVVFPRIEEPFGDISEKTFLSPLPEVFARVQRQEADRAKRTGRAEN